MAFPPGQHRLKTDRRMLTPINKLIEDVQWDPFTDIGQPEPLDYHLPGPGRGVVARNRVVRFVPTLVRLCHLK